MKRLKLKILVVSLLFVAALFAGCQRESYSKSGIKVLYEELHPDEFIERINECPIAYLPLGTLEWEWIASVLKKATCNNWKAALITLMKNCL